MKAFLILLIAGVTVSGYPFDLSEGDTCRAPEGKGVCKKIRDCPQAIQSVKMGIKPVKCGFIRKEVIVCCIKERVSQKECNKYRQVYHPDLRFRVLRGRKISDEDLPHMAAIGYFKKGRDDEFKLLCSGTLISEQFIMTAAHCLTYMFKPEVVYLGISISEVENNINGFIKVEEKNLFVHPLYRKTYHDIGLVKLSMRVDTNSIMVPACLFTMEDDPDGPLVVAGFGSTNPEGTTVSPDILLGNITSYKAAECEESYRLMFTSGINNSLICAGDPEGGIDPCRGDSGGPLLTKDKAGYYSVFGITSVGKTPCGSPYSLYTRVSAYVDWIESIVWSSSSNQEEKRPRLSPAVQNSGNAHRSS